MAFDLGVVQDAANRTLANIKPPDLFAPMKTMAELKNVQLQQQDTQAQIAERQALAQKNQAGVQKAQQAAQVIHDHVLNGGDIDDPELLNKLYGVDPTIGDTFAKNRSEVANQKSEIARRLSESNIAGEALKETQKKNAFDQLQATTKAQREADELARKNAEEAAGTIIQGSEFSTADPTGKPARAAQFRVRQPDGTYKNETRILGTEMAPPVNPPQPTPPLDPGRFLQEKELKQMGEDAAAKKAAGAVSDDPRLAGVSPKDYQTVKSAVLKADNEHTAALAATDRMNTVLKLAKSGNKEAQASASLIGVQAINELAGVKRVNGAEIASYGNAGSLIDSLEGKLGKIVAGKPIPDDVLKDMQALHDALGSNTDTIYQRKLQGVDKVYNSHFSSAAPTATAPAGGWKVISVK
jgi:hypothetical protein